jgi:outer membrane receptor protein involved in Fe transport
MKLLRTTVFLLAFIPGGLFAQALEEIVVTARKTSESLQEVPLAITAITADEINRLGINNLNQIVQQDTSVQFDEGFTPSDTRVTIRGLSPTRGRPNVATLVDGIDVGSEAVSNPGGSVLVNPRLLDVERIEIVKGPQSALYGRSAFAGAIQYVTKDPSDVLEGDISIDANNEEDKQIRGSVSVPLTSTLGMLANGYLWDEEGYYNNSVTGGALGGGEGVGASVTFKFEPTDDLSFKWRTEYTDDETAPTAQTGLNAFNSWFDAGNQGNLDGILGANNPRNGGSNLAPNSSNCFTAPGQPGPGPLANPACSTGEQLNLYFANNFAAPYSDPTVGFTPNLGQYDPTDVFDFNQYNKQIVSAFAGKVPNGGSLRATVNPNYQWGPGAADPRNAVDFEGIDKEVFRTSLVAVWNLTDTAELTSYSSYTDADVTTQQDLSRFWLDNCFADPNLLDAGYRAELESQGLSFDEMRAYSPCNPAHGDGVNDAKGSFTQDDWNQTTQVSQELRLNWDVTEALNFTTGLLYWSEKVDLLDSNSTLVTGGPACNIFQSIPGSVDYTDSTQVPGAAAFLQIIALQDQCANTEVAAAYWTDEAWQARTGESRTFQNRETDHWSWYGSLDFEFTEKLSARVEARYTKEENDVIGPVMTPCIGGDPVNEPGNPDSCITGGAPNRNKAGAGGQATGPSVVVLCGQTGRCDSLGYANTPVADGGSFWYAGNNTNGPLAGNFDGASWWPWGFAPMTSFQGTPPTRTDRYWAPRVTLEYFVTDDVMTYFSWSRGVKPGGYSLLTVGAFGLDPNLDGVYDEAEFEPERLDVWEIGAKTTLLDGRVRLNGAMFYQDFKDKQISLQKIIGNTTGVVTENIDGSEIYGLELDATWQISENWLTQLGYTYLDSEYTDYTVITNSATTIVKTAAGPSGSNCSTVAPIPGSDPAEPRYGCMVSLNGNSLERTPKHAVLANLTYTNALFDTGMDWYGEANYRYQSSRYIEQFNIAELESYDRTALRFGLMADSWDIQLYVENLFDDDEVLNAGPAVGIANAQFVLGVAAPPDVTAVIAGPNLPQDMYANMPDPRIIGLRFNARFGGG